MEINCLGNPNGKTNIQLALAKLSIVHQWAGYRLSGSSLCSSMKSKQHSSSFSSKEPLFHCKEIVDRRLDQLEGYLEGKASPTLQLPQTRFSSSFFCLFVHWGRGQIFPRTRVLDVWSHPWMTLFFVSHWGRWNCHI